MGKSIDAIIDWERDTLLVTEDHKNFDYIACLVEAIELGIRLPDVYVLKSEKENLFFLNEDGHHRSLAYYVLGRPMPVKVVGIADEETISPYWENIGDTYLETDNITIGSDMITVNNFVVPTDFYLTERAQQTLESCLPETQEQFWDNVLRCQKNAKQLPNTRVVPLSAYNRILNKIIGKRK